MKKTLAVLTALIMALSMCLSSGAIYIEGQEPPRDGLNHIMAASDLAEAPELDYRQQQIAEYKATLPYQGVNIWLGGEYMTFADAVPAVIDGRTQAPYRAVLEAMGAQVDYDNGKITASFPDGSVMALAIGSKVMTYTKGDKVTTVEMDVAPFIDKASGRTFVPIRFIGETLGKTVTWNSDIWVAYVVDWDKKVEEMDKAFSNVNSLLAVGGAKTESGKNYNVDLDLGLSIAEKGKAKPAKLSLSGKGITDGKAFSANTTFGLDLGSYNEGGEIEQMLLALLNNAKLDMISGEEGLYLRAGLLSLISSGQIPEDAWVGVKADDLAGLTQVFESASTFDTSAFTQLAQNGQLTVGQVIRVLCEDGRMGEEIGFTAPDRAADILAAVYDALLGDDHFKVSQSGGTVRYKLSTDKKALMAVIKALDPDMSAADLADINKALTFSMDMNVTAKDGVVTLCTAKLNFALRQEDENIKVNLDLSGNLKKTKLAVNCVLNDIKVDLTLDETLTETDQAPEKAPAGQVIDLAELLDMVSVL